MVTVDPAPELAMAEVAPSADMVLASARSMASVEATVLESVDLVDQDSVALCPLMARLLTVVFLSAPQSPRLPPSVLILSLVNNQPQHMELPMV